MQPILGVPTADGGIRPTPESLRTKFIVRKVENGIELVQLHYHESLKEKEGHTELRIRDGQILDLSLLPMIDLVMLSTMATVE